MDLSEKVVLSCRVDLNLSWFVVRSPRMDLSVDMDLDLSPLMDLNLSSLVVLVSKSGFKTSV